MATDACLADCRTRIAFDPLSNTWHAVVLRALRDGPRRPLELRPHAEVVAGHASKPRPARR